MEGTLCMRRENSFLAALFLIVLVLGFGQVNVAYFQKKKAIKSIRNVSHVEKTGGERPRRGETGRSAQFGQVLCFKGPHFLSSSGKRLDFMSCKGLGRLSLALSRS